MPAVTVGQGEGAVKHYACPAAYGSLASRLGETPGTTKMYLHHGGSPVPLNQVNPNPAPANPFSDWEARVLGRGAGNWDNSPWKRTFRSSTIKKVINHFIAKHHAGADAEAALDALLYRTFLFKMSQLPNARENQPWPWATPMGHSRLQLPQDYTLSAYYDAFRNADTPSTTAPRLSTFMNSTNRHIIWTGYQACFSMAASITWPAHLLSMTGQVIAAINSGLGNQNNQFIANLGYALTEVLRSTDLSVWQIYHRYACALMYDFAPTEETMLTHAPQPMNGWNDNTAPFFTNAYHELWSGQIFPRLFELPSTQQGILWPEGEDRPVTTVEPPTNGVRVARDLPAFTGRAFLQDGGSTANLQYYYAVGLDGHYRYEPASTRGDIHEHLQLGTWNTPFQQEWPANPSTFASVAMGAPGTPWADFLLPGSLMTYNLGQNRIRALGTRLNPESTLTASQQRALGRDWYELSASGGDKNVVRSLCISYIPPFPVKFETNYPSDYSMAVWADVNTNAFTGVSFWTAKPKENMFPNTPTATDSAAPYLASRPSFPSSFMNANPPAVHQKPAHPIPPASSVGQRNKPRTGPQMQMLKNRKHEALIEAQKSQWLASLQEQARIKAAAQEQANQELQRMLAQQQFTDAMPSYDAVRYERPAPNRPHVFPAHNPDPRGDTQESVIPVFDANNGNAFAALADETRSAASTTRDSSGGPTPRSASTGPSGNKHKKVSFQDGPRKKLEVSRDGVTTMIDSKNPESVGDIAKAYRLHEGRVDVKHDDSTVELQPGPFVEPTFGMSRPMPGLYTGPVPPVGPVEVNDAAASKVQVGFESFVDTGHGASDPQSRIHDLRVTPIGDTRPTSSARKPEN
uniref:Uncharacterized protein n=1 Tax=Sclerotium rolfsii RNA virus 1 TaxID=1908381 RepID=A0A3G8EWB1_9VIRU|nr:hypothetical protein [Sclerotium rolfsii RNA virus 1]